MRKPGVSPAIPVSSSRDFPAEQQWGVVEGRSERREPRRSLPAINELREQPSKYHRPSSRSTVASQSCRVVMVPEIALHRRMPAGGGDVVFQGCVGVGLTSGFIAAEAAASVRSSFRPVRRPWVEGTARTRSRTVTSTRSVRPKGWTVWSAISHPVSSSGRNEHGLDIAARQGARC